MDWGAAMEKTRALSSVIVGGLLWAACSPPQGQRGAGSRRYNVGNELRTAESQTRVPCTPQAAGQAGASECDSQDIYADDVISVPKFQSVQLDSRFNRGPKAKARTKDKADIGKKFLLQRIDAYRPIWLNVKGSTNAGLWFANWGTEYGQSPTWSAFQPLPFAADSDFARGDQYRIVGHVLHNKAEYPPASIRAAVVSLYPDGPDDMSIMAPVQRFKLLFSELGPDQTHYMNPCTRVQEAASEKKMPESTDEELCTAISSGVNQINSTMSVQYGPMGLNVDTFYKLMSVSFWRPIPPPGGYRCLGIIVGNSTDQPYTSMDAAGVFGQTEFSRTLDQQTGQGDAQFCFRYEYLTEGKLVQIAERRPAANERNIKGIKFYKILPKDPDVGVSDTGMFWAIAEGEKGYDEENPQIKVWVLKKKYVKELPDKLIKR